jgi:hypothetical protein
MPAIVVPWRPGDPDRERAWTYCRKVWERFGWPIFEVEHAGTEPFNRSWCINEGARQAGDFDVLVIVDADVFEEDARQVVAGYESALETGRLTVPHRIGADLSRIGTDKLLEGRHGWEEFAEARRDPCTSRVWMMRRDLFEKLGGFDARFQGWGHEDIACWAAAVVLRGADQLPGTAWHLWHEPSLPIARPTREWNVGRRLAERYSAALRDGWPVVERVLNERNVAQRYVPGEEVHEIKRHGIDVVVISAGRQDYIAATIDSFNQHVHGKIVRRTIQDDSGNERFSRWLHKVYPDWDIHTTPGKLGYTGAMRSIWEYESQQNGQGSPFIFHLEEDFTFDRDVDLDDLISVLEYDESLAQVALLRHAWAPAEKRVGGIIQERPDTYEHLLADGIPYLRHRNFWTTNPCVYRRSLIDDGWPDTRGSEQTFGRSQWSKGRFAAFIGDGEPWVTHIGDVRVGIGY